MAIEGFEIFSLWVEALLSLVTVMIFLWVGLHLFLLATQASQRNKQRSHPNSTRLKATQSGTSHARDFLTPSPKAMRIIRRKKLMNQFRFVRIRQFQRIAKSLIHDVRSFSSGTEELSYEARTMLPLIAEARLLGERLLSERRKLHKLLHPKMEFQIENTIHDLIVVETKLRSIPKTAYTLEDVVAGKFRPV